MSSPNTNNLISSSMVDLHLKLTEISLLIRKKLRNYFDNEKISLNQYRILRFLKEVSNLSLSSLEEKVIMKKGNLSRNVDSMVRQGLIDRQRDKSSDRRKVALSLTQKGKIVLEELVQKQNNLIKSIYKPIPEEEIKLYLKFLSDLQDYMQVNDE